MHVCTLYKYKVFINIWLYNNDLVAPDLIDVIDDDGGYRDDLRRAGGHDRHQDQEQDGVLARGPQQLLGHERRGQALGHRVESDISDGS